MVTSVFDLIEEREGLLQSGMEKGAGETYDRLADYLRTTACTPASRGPATNCASLVSAGGRSVE